MVDRRSKWAKAHRKRRAARKKPKRPALSRPSRRGTVRRRIASPWNLDVLRSVSEPLVYVTAAVGPRYHRAALGLVRSFLRTNSGPLVVFTDAPRAFERFDVLTVAAGPGALNSSAFYARGQRRNVMKISFLEAVHSLEHDLSTCWLDADTLVFDDLTRHIDPRVLNVITHGGRAGQSISCGGGLTVDGERYVISGVFSVTAPMCRRLMKIAAARRRWRDPGGTLGDQPILNHLVHRSGLPVRFLDNDRRFVYNLEISDAVHPVLRDAGLARLSLEDQGLELDGRRVVLFNWIFNHWLKHHRDRYRSFAAPVSELMRELYA